VSTLAAACARRIDNDAMTNYRRCAWAGNDPLMQAYHDEEWGVP
jgi:DNA-3-methyladenine glycosylase I